MKGFKFFIVALVLSAFAACGTSGSQAEVGEAEETATASNDAMDLDVNTSSSMVSWVGSKPTGEHSGTISIKEGTLSVKGGTIEAGNFVLDMNSITVTDLKAGEGKEDLEGHLKGNKEENVDHFFNVAKYPTAKYEITKVTALENDSLMSHIIYGNLTVKDSTKNVAFKANVKMNDDGLVAESEEFKINRTDFGVNYGSKSVFSNLGDKFINDDIALKINLVASESALDNALGGLKGAVDGVKNAAEDVKDGAMDVVKEGADAVKEGAEDMKDGAKEVMEDVKESVGK